MKLIKITATWCLSCILMNELLKKIDQDALLNYRVIELDFDNDKEQFKNFDIGNILPVYIILDINDKEIKRLVGEKSKQELQDFLIRESDLQI